MRRFVVGISGMLLGMVFSAMLQGCTTLNAERVSSAGEMKTEGAPYNLTFTQYDFTIKRRLASCVKDPEFPAAAGETKAAEVKIVTTVEATRKEARDPAHEYIIDFAALRSFFKTTDIAVEYYDNGALKSVNAAVQDHTGEFLKSSISVAAKVAMLGSGVGGPETDACKEKVAEMVIKATRSEKDLASKNAALTRQTQRLERLVAVATALGPTKNASERRAFADEIKALVDAKVAVEEEQDALAGYLKKLTITTKMTWPIDGATFSGQLVAPLTSSDVRDWASLSESGVTALSQTGVWALFESGSPSVERTLCGGAKCSRPTEAGTLKGLKYRLAMPGTFKACRNNDCSGDDAELFKDAGLFSQLGPIMSLPLRNYPFMSQTVVLTMNEAGQPTKVGYRSEAGAEKAMEAVSTFVDEYGKVRQARRPKSDLDQIKEQTELLEAKAKLATAKAALEPNPSASQATTTAALKADTALLEAELAKLKAQAALDEALKQVGA